MSRRLVSKELASESAAALWRRGQSLRSEAVRPFPVPQLIGRPWIGDRDHDAGVEPSELSCSARELAAHRVASEEARAKRLIVPRAWRVENDGTARRRPKPVRVEIEDPGAGRDRPQVRGSDCAVGRIVRWNESRAFLRHHEVSVSGGCRCRWDDGDSYGDNHCEPQHQSLHLFSPFVPTLNVAENATTEAARSHLSIMLGG